MNKDTFRQALHHADGYQTPRTPSRRRIDALCGGSDAWYYARLFGIVLAGARQAKRGTYTREVWVEQSLDTWALVEACGGRLDVSGLEHLRTAPAPRVYVANHMSLLETFLLPALVASIDLVAIVLKEELLTVPFFGRLLHSVHPITVTRTDPRQDLKRVLTEGREALRTGRSVLIFPQSTRTATFHPGTFNSLGTKLADRAGAPLLPIALKTDFMGIGKWIKDFGRIDRSQTVHVRVGAPLSIDGKVREAQRAAAHFIASTLREWGGRVAEEAPSTP